MSNFTIITLLIDWSHRRSLIFTMNQERNLMNFVYDDFNKDKQSHLSRKKHGFDKNISH